MEDSYSKVENCLLTMKGRILRFIQQDPPVTSEDIQAEFDIKPSTASEHLSDLENKGLIRREKRGKKKYIYPTDFSYYWFFYSNF